jgi:hypothetical protein
LCSDNADFTLALPADGELALALLDLLEVGELFLSWRLYVGIAATALACWPVIAFVPNQTIVLAICIPIAITGILLSFRWQVRADTKT